MGRSSRPGPQQKCFAAYLDGLAQVRSYPLPAMTKHGPVVAWIVDYMGFVKKGSHSVGVARQYCGQVGQQERCRVAVSLSVTTSAVSLPIAWRLYLPEVWARNRPRREEAGVPEEIGFQTKPQIALEQIRQAVAQGIPRAVVLADPGYGNDTAFRTGVKELGLQHLLEVPSSISVWKPGEQPLPAQRRKEWGRPARRLRRAARHQPVSTKQLARELPSWAWKDVGRCKRS